MDDQCQVPPPPSPLETLAKFSKIPRSLSTNQKPGFTQLTRSDQWGDKRKGAALGKERMTVLVAMQLFHFYPPVHPLVVLLLLLDQLSVIAGGPALSKTSFCQEVLTAALLLMELNVSIYGKKKLCNPKCFFLSTLLCIVSQSWGAIRVGNKGDNANDNARQSREKSMQMTIQGNANDNANNKARQCKEIKMTMQGNENDNARKLK